MYVYWIVHLYTQLDCMYVYVCDYIGSCIDVKYVCLHACAYAQYVYVCMMAISLCMYEDFSICMYECAVYVFIITEQTLILSGSWFLVCACGVSLHRQ